MRWGLLVLVLTGCTNGPQLWQTCESWEDCREGWGCAWAGAEPGYCVLLCEDDGVCDDLFGETGPDSETSCATPARCSPDDTWCACTPELSPGGEPIRCEIDLHCSARGVYNTCLDGMCQACSYSGCGLQRCNDDSDCAGARCVGGTCRP